MATLSALTFITCVPFILLAIWSVYCTVWIFYINTGNFIKAKLLCKKFKKHSNKGLVGLNVTNYLYWIVALYLVSAKFMLNSGFVIQSYVVLLYVLIYVIFRFLALVNNVYNTQNLYFFALLVFSVVVLTVYLATSVLELVFFFELLGYLFFMYILDFSRQVESTSKALAGILNYFWSSFITVIVLVLANLSLLYTFNTTNWDELMLFTSINSYNVQIASVLLILGLSLKFGVLGVHFLKSETYKYLGIISMFFFSIMSISVYYVMLVFLLVKTSMISSFLSSFIVKIFLVMGSILLVFLSLGNYTVISVLAISSIVTSSIVLGVVVV